MKVIFLDIDGVMMTHASHYTHKVYWKHIIALKHSRYSRFDPKAIQLLNEVIRSTGAKIVLSSSWRNGTIRQAKELLKEQGIIGDVLGSTPFTNLTERQKYGNRWITRGKEIQKWLNAHPKVKTYLILDDDSDFLSHQKRHHLKTSYTTGGFIHFEQYKKTIKILGEKTV